MSDLRVASRYARSLIELSAERGQAEQVHTDMKLVHATVQQNRQLSLTLGNPIINAEKKLTILKAIFGDKVSALTITFFELVTRKGRAPLLFATASEFHEQYLRSQGIDNASVTTAIPFTEEMRAGFKTLIKTKTGKTVELREIVDPSIIGGYILQAGDEQIDESVAGKLAQIKLKLTDTSYIPKY